MSSCDLRIVDLEGSEPRILYRDEAIASVLPQDWSPDGQHILATFVMKDGTDQLVMVSVADGSTRVLKTFDAASGSDAGNITSLSPDGRFVVYDSRSDPESPERDIHVLSVDGSLDRPLVEHAANDYVLGWSPEGNWVLFASDRQGTLGAWAVQVVDAKQRGLPKLVRSDIPSTAWGMFARNASYYYARVVWVNDVYVTTIDPETGKAGPPYKLVEHVGFNTAAEWSPDGRYLAYAIGGGRFVLGIRSVETGEDVRFRLEMERLGGHAFEPHWSPDGQALLGSGRQGIRRIDAHTGEVSLLVGSPGGCPGGGDCIEWPVWASDGRTIFTRFVDGVPRRIFARELESGLEEELYRVTPPAAVSQLAVSLDARRLAFIWSDTDAGASALMVIPTAAGAEPRELIALSRPEGNVPGFDARRGAILRPAWSPDGRHVLFTTLRVNRQGWGFELWRIPSAGGEPEILGLEMQGLRPYGLSVHPDGRRVAITAGTPRRQETWMMKDLLVPLSTEDATEKKP
jgi:Tol biopolymer transport system component